MANPFNPKRKRGVNKARASRKGYVEPKHRESQTSVLCNGSANRKGQSYSPAFFECFETTESTEDHIIPRRSLTHKQHLKIFPPTFETEVVKSKQFDKHSGKMVEVTDTRATYRSDKTLLRTNKPERFGGDYGTRFKRQTSKTKVVETETEYQEVVKEVPTIEEI